MRIAAAAFVLVLVALFPQGATAQVRFEGFATITGFAGTCADYDPTGDEFVVRYRPGGLTGNPANSGLSFFSPTGAYNYMPNGGFSGNFKPVTENEIFDYHGTQPDSQVRFTSQTPANVNATTSFINVSGQIENFDFMAGCRVRFIMSVAKRF